MLLADAGALYSPVAVILTSAAAILGALIAIVRMRGDTNSQAVSQARGAMETMQELNEALMRERDYWRSRFEACHTEKNELAARLLASNHPSTL